MFRQVFGGVMARVVGGTKARRTRKRSKNQRRPGVGAIEALEQRQMLARDLLIADLVTDSILRFDGVSGAPLGAFVPSGSGGLVDPHDPTFGPNGDLYVVSNAPGARKILRFDGTTGASLGTFVNTGVGGFAGATALAFGPNGDLYAATGGPTVLRYDGGTGAFLGVAAGGNGIQRACGAEFGPDGNLYVLDADSFNNTAYDRILRFAPDTGQFFDVFVQSGSLEDSCLFAFGPDGHLYVPDLKLKQTRSFNGTTGELQQVFPRDNPLIESFAFDVVFGPDGNAYVPTAERILRYEGETGQFLNTFVEGRGGAITFFPPPGPPSDLAVSQVHIPVGAVQGSDLSITYTVTNNSVAPTSVAAWADVVYLSTDDVFDPTDLELGRIARTTALGGGASYTETLAAPLPALSLGDYHVFVFADRRGMTNDPARLNNLRRASDTLEVFPPLCVLQDPNHAIAVGRVLSSYSAVELGGNDLTITYSVYNLQPCVVTGVLLATTLQPGVTVEGASAPLDRSGSELVWNLGTLDPYSHGTVSLTVSRTNPLALQIDGGARAFGTVQSRAVSDEAPVARLRSEAIDPALLAATVDANAADPFIQEKAAELNYAASEIFAFLKNEVGYESYAGSLRGARGTLWSSAGNSLDESSLMVALLRASGIPARYTGGTLNDAFVSPLILSMFPANFESVGLITTGATVAEPVNDPQLIAEARDHYSVQFDAVDGDGAIFTNADPSFPTASFGDLFAPVTMTFAEVPDNLRHKVTVRLDRELAIPAIGLFTGGSPLTEKTVLDATFTAAELVGKPLTISHFVQNSTLSAVFTAVTNNYSPYLAIGDEGLPLEESELIRGTDYQEFITNFPLGTQVLTGLYLNIALSAPGGATEIHRRTLFDRIGFDIRQNGGTPALQVGANSPPALEETDAFTLFVMPSRGNSKRSNALPDQLQTAGDRLQSLPENDLTGETRHLERIMSQGMTRIFGDTFQNVSDLQTERLADAALVRAYVDQPRLAIVSSRLAYDSQTQTGNVAFAIDLSRDTVRVEPFPGQNPDDAPFGFHIARGIFENVLERDVLASVPTAVTAAGATSAASVFDAAINQNIELVAIDLGSLAQVDTLSISKEAKSRITQSVGGGKVVVVPARSPIIAGDPAIGWYEIDPDSGETIGVSEDGSHGGLLEYTILDILSQIQSAITTTARSALLGVVSGQLIGVAYKVCSLTGDSTGCQGLAARAKLDVIEIVGNLPDKANISQEIFGLTVVGTVKLFAGVDPPVPPVLSNPNTQLNLPGNVATADVPFTDNAASQTLTGSAHTDHVTFKGDLQFGWTPAGASSYSVQALDSPAAQLRDAANMVVGTGAVSISAPAFLVAVAGNALQEITGHGELSFYSAATNGLGASGEFTSYTNVVRSNNSTAELTVTSDAIRLNGVLVPAGTYRIVTGLATLQGSGPATSPNLVGSVQFSQINADVSIGPGSGTLGSLQLAANATVALRQFTGTGSLTADTGSDTLALQGTALDLLRIAANPSAVTANQNTPASTQFAVTTSFDDRFTLVAEAPPGWSVAIDNAGFVTILPAPGVQGGTFPVRLTIRSALFPQLFAATDVPVAVNATTPGITVGVDPDPLLFVPYFGAQVPTAFRAMIHNEGPAVDTFAITFPAVPTGFEVRSSTSSVTIPAGETAIVGVYLVPNGLLPAPGTVVSFDVVATSTTDMGITATETENFVVPEIHGVSFIADPAELSTTPGVGLPTALVLQSFGNVPETVLLSANLPAGLSVTGLSDQTLAVGELKVFFVTLTPNPGVPLNTRLTANFTASFGAPETVKLPVPVHVVAPGVESIARAAAAARVFGNLDLANRLDDLGIAITNLVGDPLNEVFKSQAIAALDSILGLLAVDPILVNFIDDLTTPRDELAAAATETQILTALNHLGTALDGFGDAVFFRNEFNFELFLNPNSQVAQPQVPVQYQLLIHHIGGVSAGTYNIGLSGLPATVLSTLSDTQVTLNRDEFASVFVTLTQSSLDELQAFSFSIDVSVDGFPEIAKSVVGSLTAREEFVSVVSVAASPPFAVSGGLVNISARVLNAVNRAQQARASFVVKDASGQEVRPPSAPVDVALTLQASLVDVELGSIDTTGLTDGYYSIEVTLTDASSQPIPGATGRGTLLVGSPLEASLDVGPQLLPPGTHTVNNALEIEAVTFPLTPPALVGQRAVAGAGDAVRNGDFVYVAGSAGISVLNIAGANVNSPQLVRVVGSATTMLRIRGNLLVATLSRPGGGSTKVDTYSLANPSNPTLLGTTGDIPYGTATDVVLTDTHAFIVIVNLIFALPGPDVRTQIGGVFAVNISNPALPFFDGDAITPPVSNPARRDGVNDGVLFNVNGSNNDGVGVVLGFDVSGGNQMTWSAVLAAPTILYVVGSSATGTDTQTGVGLVRVVDISDPRNMRLLRDVSIPGTVHILDIALQGDRAIVTGTKGGLADFTPGLPFTGNVVQATLDLTDPANPQLIDNEELTLAARGVDRNASLGGGLYAFSGIGAVGNTPGLFVADLRDPGTFVKTTVPVAINSVTAGGDLILTTDGASLIIYRIPTTQPLTLVGFEPIPSRGVAARNNVAYACSASGIKVIDYSDPTNPVLQGTAGSGFYIGCRIQDNLLLAERFVGVGLWLLDVYSIQNNPLSPVLLGSTPTITNYTLPNNTSGLEANSTHAFLTRYTYCSFIPSNDIFVHLGDLFSIALNLDNAANPTSAAPQLVNVLFNTFGDSNPGPGDVSGCPLAGGDHNVFGVAMANPQTAYLAASSVVGGNTQAGIGRIHVVDVTNPASPSLVRNLDIPGTVQAVGIGISGDTGVVIGSTDGWVDNPSTGLRNGNLTVTTLDLSDPLNPQIVAHRVLGRRSRAFWTNTGALGGKLFGFSSIDFVAPNTNPDLLLIDVSNPRNPSVISTGIPLDTAPPNSISYDGQYVFTADGNGVSIYQLNALPIPVTASVRIPNGTGVEVVSGSFSTPPDQILVGADFNTLVWNTTLSSIRPSLRVTWDSTVTDLQPGEARRVTLDTQIDFGFQGAPGQILLPPERVVAEQVLALDPVVQTVRPGEMATYTLRISNPTQIGVNYNLSVAGVPADWVNLPAQVTVPAGGTVNVPLKLTSDPFTPLATHGFVVTAIVGSVSGSVEGTLILAGEPVLPPADPQSHGVVVELTPMRATAGQGTTALGLHVTSQGTVLAPFVVRVTNTGSIRDTFHLSLGGLPAGFTATFRDDRGPVSSVDVPPGAGNFREVSLVIVPPAGTPPGDYPFVVTAVSAMGVCATDDTQGIVTVLALGVDLQLTPSSGSPGGTLEMRVTNTGQVTDTYDLSLAAPAALGSTLGTESVTLGPGQSQIVSIHVGPLDFALPGSLQLVGVARSRTDGSVRDVDQAAINIAGFLAMTAALDVPVVSQSMPGDESFLIRVLNSGNLEDQYSATITATSGPVTASLAGLDGMPTQTIQRFRLPGLSQGALLLNATTTGSGQSTVTVQIRSLTDPSIVATVVATLLVNAPPLNAPPVIGSNGGGESASVSIVENTTAVTDVNATDADADANLVFSISGGADADKFSIDPSTGVLTFKTAPDFERPTDAGGNNVYDVIVQVSDGTAVDTQAIAVMVTNAFELQSFDVQRGATQRSYVRYVDFVFDDAAELQRLLDAGRLRLTRFDLNGNNGASVGLAGRTTRTGASLAVDFGIQGIGGNRNNNAGDGYYRFSMDTDGDGSFETTRSFYRLFGDVTGDHLVSDADVDAIARALGQVGPNLAADVNGDGVVNALDRTYATRAKGQRLLDGLNLDD